MLSYINYRYLGNHKLNICKKNYVPDKPLTFKGGGTYSHTRLASTPVSNRVGLKSSTISKSLLLFGFQIRSAVKISSDLCNFDSFIELKYL